MRQLINFQTSQQQGHMVFLTSTGTVVRANSGATPKSNSMHSLVDAARGGLIAFGTVYNGLEDNAKVNTCCGNVGQHLLHHVVTHRLELWAMAC